MHTSLEQINHRPWPLPRKEWIWRQSWLDLAFIHYPVRAEEIAGRVPAGLKLQLFDGCAWVGVVPFLMEDVMIRALPAMGSFSRFPELNVRTYVERDGKAGVWFFSLDADSSFFVWGGRTVAGLPYFKASMQRKREGELTHFSSSRKIGGARFKATYGPTGKVFTAEAGTFEQWAAERYCLYSLCRGRLKRLEIHHAPWPLQACAIEMEANEMLRENGIRPMNWEPICHYSAGVKTITFGAENEEVRSSKFE